MGVEEPTEDSKSLRENPRNQKRPNLRSRQKTLNFLKSQRNWMGANRKGQLRILTSLRKNPNMMRPNLRSQRKSVNFLKSQRNWRNWRSQRRILNSPRENPRNQKRPNLRSRQKTLNFLKSQRNWMRANRKSHQKVLNLRNQQHLRRHLR